jgi:hypothetical protein
MEYKITVIFRDDSPVIHYGDSPSYRTQVINLTPEQRDLITPKCTGTSFGNNIFESISKCIIEPTNPAPTED